MQMIATPVKENIVEGSVVIPQERAAQTFNPREHLINVGTEKKPSEYLEVKWRLVWFRQECPTGTIETEIVHMDLDKDVEAPERYWDDDAKRYKNRIKKAKGMVIFRATIHDGKGGSATGTKSENAAAFPDFIEKAESGSIGRALAALGFGTQFAPELNEEQRIVDAPVDVPSNGGARNQTGANNGARNQNQRPPQQSQNQQSRNQRPPQQNNGVVTPPRQQPQQPAQEERKVEQKLELSRGALARQKFVRLQPRGNGGVLSYTQFLSIILRKEIEEGAYSVDKLVDLGDNLPEPVLARLEQRLDIIENSRKKLDTNN